VADFRAIPGESRITYLPAVESFAMDPGRSADIALWGGGPGGEALEIVSLNENVVEAWDVTLTVPTIDPNLRRIKLIPKNVGQTVIEARLTRAGPVWARAGIGVGVTPGVSPSGFADTDASPRYTGDEPAIALDAKWWFAPDTYFDVRASHVPPLTRPLFDDETHAVVGYVYRSLGFFRYFDVFGNVIGEDEVPVETPLFDPIDVILIFGDLAVVAGRGILKAGIRAASRAGTRITIRGILAGALEAMRVSWRSLIVFRNLKFTTTTAARMADPARRVPVQILQLAIRFGRRTADPQGAKGAFRYVIKMLRNEGEYNLEVVIRESDSTVLHFVYGSEKAVPFVK
jgi:hypothetical protein